MTPPQGSRSGALQLGLLFAAVYFIQGMGSPTDGVLAQPVRSLLKAEGHGAGTIAALSAVAAIPWALKPLFGLVSDARPWLGYRRRSYLIAATAATALAFAGLFAAAALGVPAAALVLLLVVATFGVAFADVLADALMVEEGQPRGITGRLQAVQWTALYAAAICAALLGGWLSERGLERFGFLLCAGLVAAACLLAVGGVREARGAAEPVGLRQIGLELGRSARTPVLLAVAGFLFLWSFNPFSNTVLYVHLTTALGFGEQLYGTTLALLSAGGAAGSVAYWFYCRRIGLLRLVHGSIVLGIAATLAYWLVVGPRSACAVSVGVGFAYATAVLVQLDLAARVCPRRWAGTVFATLMALSNVSVSLSEALGGWLYEAGSAAWGAGAAFDVLVAVGAGLTALCWLLVPVLRRCLGGPRS